MTNFLAAGTHGKVYKVSEKKVQKKMNIYEDGEFLTTTLSEICFLNSFSVDFIPKIYETIFTKDEVILEQEYGGQTLSDFSKSLPYVERLNLIKPILYQMARMLYWMEENNVVHMDIKPANMCIDENKKLYLIDWGHSCPRYNEAPSYYGTELYADPSYLDEDNGLAADYNYDVFGMACTMYYFLRKSHPDETKVLSWDFLKSHVDDKIINLLREMSNLDSFKRISGKTLYLDPIFKDERKQNPCPKTKFGKVYRESNKHLESIDKELIQYMHEFCKEYDIRNAFANSVFILERYLSLSIFKQDLKKVAKCCILISSYIICNNIFLKSLIEDDNESVEIYKKLVLNILNTTYFCCSRPMVDWNLEMSKKLYSKLLDLYSDKSFRNLPEKRKAKIIESSN